MGFLIPIFASIGSAIAGAGATVGTALGIGGASLGVGAGIGGTAAQAGAILGLEGAAGVGAAAAGGSFLSTLGSTATAASGIAAAASALNKPKVPAPVSLTAPTPPGVQVQPQGSFQNTSLAQMSPLLALGGTYSGSGNAPAPAGQKTLLGQ